MNFVNQYLNEMIKIIFFINNNQMTINKLKIIGLRELLLIVLLSFGY